MGSKLIIEGNRPLNGVVRINGAKNSALKLMVAALLGQGEFFIDEVPQITDVFTMCGVLEALGVSTELTGNQLKLNVGELQGRAPNDLAKSMRASVQVMGPLLAKLGWVQVARPGGCAIGTRSLDLHLDGLAKMGASIELQKDLFVAKAKQLYGADITFRYPSVGATENIMMAATLAKGETIIRNAAKEPEIIDIQEFLNSMGAKVSGAGSSVIRVSGVSQLGSTRYRVIPDRIEAGTYLLAFLITGGQGILENVNTGHLTSLLRILEQMGAQLRCTGNTLEVASTGRLKPFKVSTNPYPGFPTDLQPQLAVLGTQAMGISILKEAVFDQRFGYITELAKLGAEVTTDNNRLNIHGPVNLRGSKLSAGDLRAGAALVLAGLGAKGISTIDGLEHIDRGYESIEMKLRKLGAKIERLP